MVASDGLSLPVLDWREQRHGRQHWKKPAFSAVCAAASHSRFAAGHNSQAVRPVFVLAAGNFAPPRVPTPAPVPGGQVFVPAPHPNQDLVLAIGIHTSATAAYPGPGFANPHANPPLRHPLPIPILQGFPPFHHPLPRYPPSA